MRGHLNGPIFNLLRLHASVNINILAPRSCPQLPYAGRSRLILVGTLTTWTTEATMDALAVSEFASI